MWNLDGRNKDAITLWHPEFLAGPGDMPMWNLDGRNKDAITLWHPEFLAGPGEQYPQPERWGRRLWKVLLGTAGWRNILPRREKSGQKTHHQQ
jgi:hypothetical protein